MFDVNRDEKEYKEQIKDLELELNYVKNKNYRLNKEIEILQNDLDRANSKLKESIEIRLKVIEYLKLFDDNSTLINHSIIKGALNILKGEDNGNIKK